MAKFKVGDKVRSLVEHFDITKGAVYLVEGVEEGGVYITDDVGDEFYMRRLEIEPADEAGLTIRAGGYYKTRDGRKVGPMTVLNSGNQTFYEVAGDGRYWTHDGAGHGVALREDLVAEWPAAKGCTAAQVDVQREEYGAPAANAAFKVGDRVRAISEMPEGRTGRVIFIDGNGTADGDYLVEFQGWGGGHNGSLAGCKVSGNNCWWLSIADMERVDAATAPAIVALIEGDQPKPATRPYVHENRDLAAKEAARLADVNKGQEFGVYELVTTRKVERTYEHEWQRLAAAGQKINAIINLRKIADINLKAAKDAVESFLDAA